MSDRRTVQGEPAGENGLHRLKRGTETIRGTITIALGPIRIQIEAL